MPMMLVPVTIGNSQGQLQVAAGTREKGAAQASTASFVAPDQDPAR